MSNSRFQTFCDSRDKESWQGYSTAFRAGCRAKLESNPCRYKRYDFIEAWERGFKTMEQFLETGGTISEITERRPPAKIKKHKFGELVEECECDACMAKKMTRARKEEKEFMRVNQQIEKEREEYFREVTERLMDRLDLADMLGE